MLETGHGCEPAKQWKAGESVDSVHMMRRK